MVRIDLRIAPEQIALFKALVESYDNLATLRTADPATHRLRLWYGREQQGEIEALLSELKALGPIQMIQRLELADEAAN
ncbi:MAG TPA: DUF4911 domain-containing protein [Candidatus Binataceae bacterium]|nr:DUF4911 domain-containing protein [Candidatus Binataceae bacterium]